jgi:iron complex outermembrane receptor protein
VGQQFLDNSGSSDRALDPYLVNDLRLNWSVTSMKGVKELSFNITVRNIFSELYESNGWSYSYIESEDRKEFVGLYPQAPVNVLGGLTVRF